MNDKDKEAFEKHLLQWEELDEWNKSPSECDAFENGFKAACEYKQKEIDKLREHLLIATNLIRAIRPNDGLKE